MKTEIKKEGQDTWLILREQIVYSSDFQMKMLEHIRIGGLLAPRPEMREDETNFYYRISGLISVENYFRSHPLGEAEIFRLTEDIVDITERMYDHLLEADRLILDPSCIYKSREGFWFCYLPISKKPFSESYHQLTEYFVRELDYGNPAAVQAGCRLHKYSMQENFHLGDAAEQVKKEIKDIMTKNTEIRDTVTGNAETGNAEIRNAEIGDIHMEMRNAKENTDFFSEKRSCGKGNGGRKKRKTSKWGDWENL